MSHVINWKRILFGNRIGFESDIESELTCDRHPIGTGQASIGTGQASDLTCDRRPIGTGQAPD